MSCQYSLGVILLLLQAARLTELRKRQQLTQKQISDAIGTSERNYRRYEASDYDVRVSTLVAIAKYLGVSTDYLLGLKDEP